MEDNFNYWDPEHYEIKEVSGSEKLCIDAFNAEAKKYPPMLYGTHILLKTKNTITGPRFRSPPNHMKSRSCNSVLCSFLKIHIFF